MARRCASAEHLGEVEQLQSLASSPAIVRPFPMIAYAWLIVFVIVVDDDTVGV